MNPEFRKVALAAAVLGLLVALFVALRPGGDNTSVTPTTTATTTTPPPGGGAEILITVVGGRPDGGIQHPSLTRGEQAVLVVTSDVADEIHLHEYDLTADVETDGTVRIPFEAAIPGRFEVELERRGVQLAELEVRP